MNLFVLFAVEDEYTYYLRLYILGHGCVEDECTYYLRLYILGHEPFCCVEDEYTYYLRLYILGHEPFCCGKMNTHIIYVYIS